MYVILIYIIFFHNSSKFLIVFLYGSFHAVLRRFFINMLRFDNEKVVRVLMIFYFSIWDGILYVTINSPCD